jgi:hypothetical protein
MWTFRKFKNKNPIHRRRKELIVLILISTMLISAIYFYTYINNHPFELSKYPTVNITTEGEIKIGEYVPCRFELETKDKHNSVEISEGQIKIRGHTNAKDKIPKKEYRLELSEQKSLLGMRNDDDWLLLAMYFDFPRMRIKMCMDLWNSLEDTDPTAILPDSEYVGLYINGNFQGLYLLAEEIDRKLFDLDDAQSTSDSSLIFQLQIEENLAGYSSGKWDQDWPNKDENELIMDLVLQNLINFIVNTSDEEFFDVNSGIFSIFNKLNLIDFLIFNFFINHKDFWNTNYFIVRDSSPSEFFLIPWDFDGSLGQRGWTFFDYDENPEIDINKDNILYKRLINNEDFRQSCQERWNYLRETLWTEEFILDMLTEIYEENIHIIEIDTKIWKPITVKDDSLVYNRYLYSTKEFELNEYIENLFQFIPERLEYCDNYFNS